MLSKLQRQIADVLIKKGALSEEQVSKFEKESEETGKDFEIILVREKVASEEEITQIKSKILKVPYISLIGEDIKDEILNIIPASVARHYKMISFDKKGRQVKVAMVEPTDYKSLEALDFLSKEGDFKTKIHITSFSSFNNAVKKYEKIAEEVEEVLERAEGRFALPEEEEKPEKPEEMAEVIKRAPVSKIVSVIIRHAVDGGASDIHAEPMEKETRIRYRIDGVLRTSLVLPKYIHSAIVSRVKVLANLKLDETRIPQDGRIRMTVDGKDIDLRVSVIPLLNQEKVVMRVLDVSKKAPTLEELGYLDKHIDIIKKNIERPHGMFLISGPTGSGKSTTLYSVLSQLNVEGVNISTLEDPIEYHLKGVNQSQVNHEVDFVFSTGLRAILRQDPDIIMVGEIRDSETAELAVHAGLTGHLIFSTIHTNDAFGVVPRLVDMGVEPFLISSTLNLVIAQRLVRIICEHCKEEVKLPDDVKEEVEKEIKKMPQGVLDHYLVNSGKKRTFYKGKGCVYCNGSGYSGRISIAEILQANKELQKIIVSGFKSEEVEEEARRQKMITMVQDGIIKALKGVTTIEEVFRVSREF